MSTSFAPNPAFEHNLRVTIRHKVERNWGYRPEAGVCMPEKMLRERIEALGLTEFIYGRDA